MNWHLGRMAAFDLETTGVDPETARVVTACVALVGGGQATQARTWVADPGVEIPAEAAAIHGYDTERARAEGQPAAGVVEEITAALAAAVSDGVPLVAMNARYDLTVLDRECRRTGLVPLVDRHGALWAGGSGPAPVIDPFVLDRATDRYRAGSRTLTALCEHYRVRLDGAHDSAADALAAARVAWRLGSTVPDLAVMPLDELHRAQVRWAAEQAESLAAHFRRSPGKEPLAESVRAEWPLVPAPEGVRVP